MRFLRANAAAYTLNPERIGAMGMSSGGHMAAFLGTSGGVKRHTVGEVTVEIEWTDRSGTHQMQQTQLVSRIAGGV